MASASEIQTILDGIPSPKTETPGKKTIFVVIGKPGSGKTSVARILAHELTTEHIDPISTIQEAAASESNLEVRIKLASLNSG